MFNDADVKIEPFSIFQDADGNKLAEKEDGMVLINRKEKESDEEDPWYESIRQQQEYMLKQQ